MNEKTIISYTDKEGKRHFIGPFSNNREAWDYAYNCAHLMGYTEVQMHEMEAPI